MVDDGQIAQMLDDATAIINEELGFITTNVTDTRYTPSLARIERELVGMMVMQTRHYKEKLEVEGVARYYEVTPDLTRAHKRTLQNIKRLLCHKSTYSYNIVTGEQNE